MRISDWSSDVCSSDLLGNSVETLVRSAPASVLVVKQRPRDDYRRVLVGTDLTPESRHGLEAAAALFPQAGFTLLHALAIPYASLWLDSRHREDLTRMELATLPAFAAHARLTAAPASPLSLLVADRPDR